jgi:hypothetical protein
LLRAFAFAFGSTCGSSCIFGCGFFFSFSPFFSPFVLSALVLDLSGFYLSGLAALASIGFVGLLQELISTKDFSTFAEFSFS